ncbi:Hypothetical predicted protein [Octopus vulgaris]|uniref:Uncharacterized protein n=1 Tax=Octopus vulgaris TaxID=6645 RepID=A0AA36AGP7_OCTVU|nr:Hypothetical predicted protein [Octopus vulgaris]
MCSDNESRIKEKSEKIYITRKYAATEEDVILLQVVFGTSLDGGGEDDIDAVGRYYLLTFVLFCRCFSRS